MAIARTQAVSANANNVAITSTTSGDIILVWAYFAGTATIPSLAGGFTNWVSSAGTGQAARLGYKISTGGEITSGTWTNATQVVCMVYRGASGIGAGGSIFAGNGTTLTYSALTLQNISSTNWVLGFGGASSATAGMNNSTLSLGNRTNQVKVCGLDTNAGRSSNFSAETFNVTTTGRWQTATLELKATVTAQGAFFMFF